MLVGASFFLLLAFFLLLRSQGGKLKAKFKSLPLPLGQTKLKSLPLPPGPKGLPIVGNLWDLDITSGWRKVAEWKKLYGDVVLISSFGKHTVFLNSWEAVNDLVEKRSSIYSDRPRQVMLNEVIGWDWGFASMPYGDGWRKRRKMFHEHFHSGISMEYRPYHIIESRLFLSRLLSKPEWFLHHIRHLAASTIMRVTYGIEVHDSNDIYIKAAEDGMYSLCLAGIPGSFVVDYLPILKYLPTWFPGATFKKLAKTWHPQVQDMINLPFNATKNAMESGKAKQSAVSMMLQNVRGTQNEEAGEKMIRDVAGIAFAAGADTTVSSLQCFFLAMLLNPEVQAKAQAQIDAVVGTDRLPEFDDLPSLPYVEATLMETLRYHPVIPFTTAHAIIEDDEYKGCRIPKGATVIPNAWSLMHDEEMYPENDRFIPERFLEANGQINRKVRHPESVAFGFGRRVCPGKHVAMDSMLLTVACVLAAFDIVPEKDEFGEPIEARDDVTPGLITHPIPFPCEIKSRRENIAKLIRSDLDVLQ